MGERDALCISHQPLPFCFTGRHARARLQLLAFTCTTALQHDTGSAHTTLFPYGLSSNLKPVKPYSCRVDVETARVFLLSSKRPSSGCTQNSCAQACYCACLKLLFRSSAHPCHTATAVTVHVKRARSSKMYKTPQQLLLASETLGCHTLPRFSTRSSPSLSKVRRGRR